MSIQRLPDSVVDKIKSSSSITSLNGVVCELVKNSLDAGARRINILVDYTRGNCTVEDDGHGIAAQEFQEHGRLAKLHSTSRFPSSPDFHGRHGNFLASLAVLSLLIIVSRASGQDSPSSLAIHHGSKLLRGSTAHSAQRLEAFSHGTRVAAFDLFGTMPVRVKHRASLFSTSSDLEKEVKRLSYELAALLLAWPATISVSLREAKSGRELRLKCPDSLELPQRTSRLLTQVGLADSSEQSSWIPVAAAFDHISVQGCISSIPVASRKAQVISLGIIPIGSSLGGNVLFEEVNEIFAASSFGLIEAADARPGSTETPGTAMPKPRKGLEKWPMFYLKFQSDVLATEGESDVLHHRSPTLSAMVSLLRAVCYAFLKRLKMRPRKFANRQKGAVAKAEGSRSSSPFSHKSSVLGNPGSSRSPFDNWRRIKIGHQATSHTIFGMQPLVGPGGHLLRKPFLEEGSDHDRMLDWHLHQHTCDNDDPKSSISSQKAMAMPETLESTARKPDSKWLNDLVGSWENPVFETAEPGLRHLRTKPGTLPKGDANVAAGSTGTNISGRVSKAALLGAEVIAQVDNKFVLVKLPLDSPTEGGAYQPSYALFLVDQHAADERCRLEQLMACYFDGPGDAAKVIIEALDQPIHFDILTKELKMFANHRKHMAKWGIAYQIVDSESEQEPKTISKRIIVTGLPPSILERCRGEPRLLIDLLRNELWSLEERPLSLLEGAAPNKNFHGCPRGILELLHSRACRSAIMFNDELTLAECSSLIRRLAQCSLPFQCAHGRPSMAPLVDLGGSMSGSLCTTPGVNMQYDSKTPVMGSANAWRTWMR